MIHEVIVTTMSAERQVHIAPMGVRREGDRVFISPFKPSTTLNNLLATRSAVINYTDDVRVFAGCLTGRYEWPVVATDNVDGVRLKTCLAHEELRVTHIEQDDLRPCAHCQVVSSSQHAPFAGFNRAQAAVIEGAVLSSRLHMLPADKVDNEFEYLQIAIDKTAGPRETEAWGWLLDKLQTWRQDNDSSHNARPG